MGKYISRRAEVGIGRESVRGTAVEPSQWIPWATLGVKDMIVHIVEESAMGRIENSDSAYAAGRHAEGTIEADVRVAYLGHILTNLLGAAPQTSGSDPYTHVYTLAQNNQHQSLSMLIQDKTNPDINKMHVLAMINKWTMSIEPGAIVKNSIDFMAKAGKDWTSATADFSALGNKFLHQHATIKVASNIAGLAAAAKLSILQLELNIEKNVLKNDVIGTVDPEDFNNQDIKVTGSLTLNFEDTTYLNYMLDQTVRAFEIVLENGASAKLTFQFPRVQFHSFDPDRTLNDIAKQSIEFVAHFDAANTQNVIHVCTLINAVSSY